MGKTIARIDKLSAFATLILLVCATTLIIAPGTVTVITGKTLAAQIIPPDELPPSAREDPTAFLARRNVVELTVREEMTVRELLELYRLNKPDQTRQVFQQLGQNTTATTIVRAGTRFKIALTPTAKDIPVALRPAAGVR